MNEASLTIGKPERHATRLIFLLCGIGQSAWAPIVPFAKARVHANDQQFGMLLLCFGVGSIVSMPAMGVLASRFGCKRLITVSAIALCLSLWALSAAPTLSTLAPAIAFFGASVGSLDVTMNVQALLVERAGTRSLMPGFHALYSVGGIAGAGLASTLLWLGAPVRITTGLIALLLAVLLAAAHRSLLPYGDERPHEKTRFTFPNKVVVLIGVLAFLFMLSEGAMLDWSAIFLEERVGMLQKQTGIGYAAFSIAMTASRFAGDSFITRLGRVRVMLLGGVLAAGGFSLAVAVPRPAAAISGFILIGLGAANLVPLLFTLAAEARGVLGNNVSFVTTLGYSGVLAGPALIGFVVHRAGFATAFGGIGVVLLAAAIMSRFAISRDPARQRA